MKYYIDVTIKPDQEMRGNFLLNNVFTKFHRLLSSIESTQIGISFPEFKVTLGGVMRIHGTKEQLDELQARDWLGGMSGYCTLTGTLPIPKNASYRTVSRRQSNMSQAKLNRLLKRGTISRDQVKAYKAKMFQEGINNPFLELESTSNGHKYRRYISFGEVADTPTLGTFDQFGFSKRGTIPWF